jgi:hypothetical protein
MAVTQGLDDPWVLCMCCFEFVDLEALGMFILQIFLNSVVVLGCCCYLSAHVGVFGLHGTCFEIEFLWSRCRVIMLTFCSAYDHACG